MFLTGSQESSEIWLKRLNQKGQVAEEVVLHGIIDGFGELTLFDGYASQQRSNHLGVTFDRYFFNSALIGVWVDEPLAEVFTQVEAEIAGLGHWLNQYPVAFSPDPGFKKVTLTAHQPDSWITDFGDDIEVKIGWRVGFNHQFRTESASKIESVPSLSCLFATLAPIADVQASFWSVFRLIQFLASAELDVRTLTLTANTVEENGKSGKPIRLRYLHGHTRGPRRLLDEPGKVLIPFTELGDRWPDVVKAWRSFNERVGPELPTILTNRHDIETYAETAFFLAASAAERLHEHLHPDHRARDRSVTAQQRADCLDLVPEAARQATQTFLGRLDHLSFRERLESLMQTTPHLTQSIIGDEHSQTVFAREMTDWRNEIAHCLETKTKYVNRTGADLYYARRRIFALMDHAVLLELGFDSEQILKRMESASRYWSPISKPWESVSERDQ